MMIYFISSHDDPHHPPHHHHLPSACPTRACSTSPGFPLRSVSTPAWTHSASSRSFCPSPSPGLGDRLAAGWEGLRVAGHQGVVLSPRQATRGGGGRWVGPTCWTCRTLFVGGLDAPQRDGARHCCSPHPSPRGPQWVGPYGDQEESQGGAGESPAVLIEGVQGEGIVVVLGICLSFTENIPTLGDFTYCDTGTSVVRWPWRVGNLDNGLSILILCLFIHWLGLPKCIRITGRPFLYGNRIKRQVYIKYPKNTWISILSLIYVNLIQVDDFIIYIWIVSKNKCFLAAIAALYQGWSLTDSLTHGAWEEPFRAEAIFNIIRA